jgi:predicted Zn-dependent protease
MTFPDRPGGLSELVDAAQLAEAQKDWRQAEQYWSAVREKSPRDQAAYVGAVIAHHNLGQLAAGEALLCEAVEKFPNQAWFMIELAAVAERKRDWPAAEDCWRGSAALQPDRWWLYSRLSRALQAQERLQEAEAVLVGARELLPDEPGLAVEYARLAEVAKNWDEASKRWAATRAAFPLVSAGYIGGVIALRAQGRLTEADALLRQGIASFPEEVWFPSQHAMLALQARDWGGAEHWCRTCLAIDRNLGWAHQGLARALIGQEKLDEAEQVLVEAGEKFPESGEIAADLTLLVCRSGSTADLGQLQKLEQVLRPLTEASPTSMKFLQAFAEIAKHRQDWEAYRTRLELSAQHFPEQSWIKIALSSARDLAPREGDLAREQPPLGASSTDSTAALIFQFESLGGEPTGGCEFGLVQRALGAEPLGLLRFATVRVEDLIRALDDRFAGLGTPQTMELRPQGHKDWQAIDTAYGIRMDHTHLDRESVSAADARLLVCKRNKFLAEKLIRDLVEAKKTFVYHSASDRSRSEIEKLFSSLRGYGNTRLLFVMSSGDPVKTPSIQKIKAGLYIGSISRLAATGGLDIEAWLGLCREVGSGEVESPGKTCRAADSGVDGTGELQTAGAKPRDGVGSRSAQQHQPRSRG